MTARHRAPRRTLLEVVNAWTDRLTNYSYQPTLPPLIGSTFAPWSDSPSQAAAGAQLLRAATATTSGAATRAATTRAGRSDGR